MTSAPTPVLIVSLPVLSTPVLVALAALPLFLWLLLRRRPLTRRASWRPGRQVSSEVVHPARMVVAQMQSDAHTNALIRLLSRIHRLRPAVEAARTRWRHLDEDRIRIQNTVDETKALANQDPEPVLGHRSATGFRVMAYTGDVAVVSAALQAENADMMPLTAAVLSLAVSTALFLIGDFGGHHLRNFESLTPRRALVGSAVALLALSLALYLLRMESTVSWIVLAVTPAVGAALIVVLGPSPNQWRLIRSVKAVGRKQRAVARADRKLARLEGRLDGLTEKARGPMRRSNLAVLAEAAGTEVDDPIINAERRSGETGLDIFVGLEPGQSTKIPPTNPFRGTLGVPDQIELNGSSSPVGDFQ